MTGPDLPESMTKGVGWGRASAVLVLVTLFAGLPLLSGRVLGGQDIINYLIHAQQTAENLRQGVFLPAWSGGYNSGYGSPVLLLLRHPVRRHHPGIHD